MKLKSEKIKKWILILLPYVLFLITSIVIMLPRILSDCFDGHDIEYHFMAINALDTAYHNGTFFSRIYELTSQDFGYGTGLFYSMIPSGIAVVLKNILHTSAKAAVFLEIILILFLSGCVTYKLLIKTIKKKKLSVCLALLYIISPYVLCNIFVRFAFSELFITFILPMIALSLYEIVNNQNYKLFIPLFVIGFSLGIMIHLTMTVYIAIFSAIYLLLNAKKFFNKKNLCIFAISSLFVLLISASFYLPMLYAYSDITLGEMGRGGSFLWFTTHSAFIWCRENIDLNFSFLLILSIYFIYLIVFIVKRKTNEKNDKVIFVISSILVFINTPLFFLWIVIGNTFLNMIQFTWRLYLLCSLIMIFQIEYIFRKFDKYLFKIFVSMLSVSVCFMAYFTFDIYEKKTINENFNERINMLVTSHGAGSGSVGDYYPVGATNEYVWHRANEYMVLASNIEVNEFANFQIISQISFYIENISSNNYAVLSIPISVCENLNIYQYEAKSNFMVYELEKKTEIIDGKEYLRIEFEESENDCKIILDYDECDDLRNYLKDNPFEFIVESGDSNARFTNFVKQSSHKYSVDINVSDKTIIELPTYFYKGYVAKYKTENGEKEIELSRSKNGFLQIEVEEKGTLNLEFKGNYITIANIISVIGIISFIVSYVIYINFDKLKSYKLNKNIKSNNLDKAK